MITAKPTARKNMNDNTTSTSGDLHAERTEYRRAELHRADINSSPLEMFTLWLQDAQNSDIIDATAMTLATATATGMPSARIVLLKQYDDNGFCWYTGYESRKGQELADNPQASLLFFWSSLERQIRIEGTVEKVSAEQSDQYFKSRPEGSQYSAASSPQSQPVPSQDWLLKRIAQLKESHPPATLQRPDNWGGYRLRPRAFEFWQGRPSRSHDRFRYTRQDSTWQIDRLAP
ncbi:MAG: pyridoxamine 5'-phosphate oxidase [Pseudomonadota bacterium]